VSRSINNAIREQAAQLLASGRYTRREVAEKLGISERSLYLWLRNPKFVALMETVLRDYRERSTQKGLAVRENRISELTRLFNVLDETLTAKGARPEVIRTMANLIDQIAQESGDKIHRAELLLPTTLAELSDEQLAALARRLDPSVPPGFDDMEVPATPVQ
jgi:AcrR family transcriptional regulator